MSEPRPPGSRRPEGAQDPPDERGPGAAPSPQGGLDETAARLATPGGLGVARALQKAGLLAARGGTPPGVVAGAESDPVPSSRCRSAAEGPPPAGPRPISIWRPRALPAGLVFERPPPVPGGDHYAARRSFAARKQTGFRVCLLGESAAAGYLYAPHLTPATVLADQLRAVAGEGAFEVVDLARTNERLATMVATARDALQLAPDLLVVFAGNNWNLLETPRRSAQFPSVRARQEYAARLIDSGLPGPIEAAVGERLAAGWGALAELAAIARAGEAEVVLVVPEVNLADWQNRQPVAWLPGDGVARWYRLYGRARRLLRQDRPADAARLARRMLDLDGGACPTTYRLLALAWDGMDRRQAAAEAARAEVASSHYATACFLAAPQATPPEQELLVRAARRHGFACVDLRRVFARHAGSPLPGRRMFLDYCHLSLEGIQVAMAAIASEVLRRTGSGEASWPELVASLPPPGVAAQPDATARLGAAIHGAHRLLAVSGKREILTHWCRDALRASPGIADTMLDLVEARAAPLPAVLTAAQQRNLASPYRLGEQHGWRYDYPDAELVRAIAAALAEAGGAGGAVEHRLLDGAAARPGPVDLAAPPARLWEPLEQPFAELLAPPDLPGRLALRALWPESDFCWLGAGEFDTPLELLARLPATSLGDGAATATLQVRVNGHPAGRVELGGSWRRTRLRLARRRLRPGLNRIRLLWPPPAAPGEVALAEAGRRLAMGVEADVHPVFGEVAALVVG